MRLRLLIRGGAAVGIALGAVALAGCTSTEVSSGAAQADDEAVADAIESSIEAQAAEDGSTVDIDIDGDGDADIPESWPAQVPVPEGEVVLAIETDGGHSLAMRAASAEAAQAYVDSMVDRGFTVVSQNPMDDGGFRLLEGEGLEVIVTWTGGDDVLLSVDVRAAE